MNIIELIAMLRRRLVYLGQIRTAAVAIGDLVQVDRIDTEAAQIQTAITKLEA
jgi:hypothetical protein